MEEKRRKRKKLKDLNLIDDFLFTEMLNLGEDSEWFCKTVVERLTGEKYKSVKFIGKKRFREAIPISMV